MVLIRALRHLDSRLVTMLGPPMPTTDEQKRIWIPEDKKDDDPTPVLERWDPPVWVPRRKDGGFWLAQNVACFQRGYEPDNLYDGYTEAGSTCFKCTFQDEENSLTYMAFDFFLAVVTTDEKVAAGCVVELRPAVDPKRSACLYISTLCTHPKYGGKGLAHQLVHAVYTLGTLLLEQNREAARGPWSNAIPNQKLCMALNVRREDKPADNHTRLIRMYSQCGLTTENLHPDRLYHSFTQYSYYDWQIDKDPYLMIPMWQEVSVSVLYEDDRIRILRPGNTDGCAMFHAFPEEHIATVQHRGIVHARHACLRSKGASPVYIAPEIRFTHTQPTTGACFCIYTSQRPGPPIEAAEDVLLLISVPSWFSYNITVYSHRTN